MDTYADADLLGWPLFIDAELMNAHQVQHAFAHNSSTVLLAACTKFDAVTTPRKAATSALVRLDRKSTALPCLLCGETGTFLVARGSGVHVSALAGVQVMAGADARITLPPTSGVRWDTPPWHLTERTPLKLPSAVVLLSCLEEALRLYPRRETGIRP
ncbi:hypothetical protein ACH4TQ_50870 [Streptomyces sp. NPDC021218]|uniref:hypothetical protein n=1 Tax=unclassified Streptomyces TaxID=2593676 RepID=UPI0036C8084B